MELSSLKLEPYGTLVFSLFIIVCVAIFLIALLCFQIWDASESENTPSFTVVAFVRLRNLLNSALSWHLDIVRSATMSPEGLQHVNQIYNSSIREAASQQMPLIISRNKNIINNYLVGSSNELNPFIRQFFGKRIAVGRDQTMSIQSVIINFIADSQNILDALDLDTLLKCCYLSQVY